jgi:hypothetical protein
MDNDTAMRTCTKCGAEKPLTAEFWCKKSDNPKGFNPACRDCERARANAWHAANREKSRQLSCEWRTANREKHLASNKRWNATHREAINENYKRWLASNRDHQRDYQRRWLASNPAKSARRRTRKRALPDTFTAEQWEICKTYFSGCCAACGRLADQKYAIAADHWIPLASPDCPGTIAKNIIPLCHAKKDGVGGCNNTKHNASAAVWLERRFGIEAVAQIVMRIQIYFEWVQMQDAPTH